MSRTALMQDVLLGFGSNLGDRRETLDAAWNALKDEPEIVPVRISRFLQTGPVGGPPSQPDYLNAVGLIRTSLDPFRLLQRTQAIEERFGRVRRERWGARTLDIDILLYGDRMIDTATLVVPHPEMLRRDFVMTPAREVAPDMIVPPTGLPLSAIPFSAGSTDSAGRFIPKDP